jgi:ribosomal protein S18 acetylase RimI-like enzyme
MDALSFREVRPDDEAELFQLFAAVRAEELRMQEWEPQLRDRMLRMQFDAQRRGYLHQFPAASARVILRGPSPVGWVIVDRSGPELRCVDIAIVSEARSQGIGTAVLLALQEEAAAADRPLVLSVLRMNVRALALYVRLGFRAVAETGLHTQMEWRR